ncbi:hypothetical+protein [Methylocapsa aurea]|jgi:hypothetical protein|uniref:hypothetical protein n=1 Tax=Methylocapsa aurea TaxID=663610 RepID=UPI003D18DC43
MNKLTKIAFARPIARVGAPFRAGAEVISFGRRARRPLIGVWTTDHETGRLVCSWAEPADSEQCLAQNANEPPPAVSIAA